MGIGRYVLAVVIAATFATGGCTAASGADRVTLEPAASSTVGRFTPAADLLPRADAGSSGPGVAVDGAIEATRTEQKRVAAAEKAAEEKAQAGHREASHPSEQDRATTEPGGGCAQQAMAAGRFDPSCSAYQGYLDPGTSAGRAPTSGEIQMRYACEQGMVPESDC